MDDIRAQLDELMGRDRNVPLAERAKGSRERKFSDPEICKYFICGFCPYEEFRRTKNDCGDCPCEHDEACRQQWEALDERSKERYGYEYELLRWFDRLLVDLRKRIDANTERLKRVDKPLLLVEDQQRLDNLAAQINDLLARAQTLGEQGDVDAAQAALDESERAKAARRMLEQQANSRAMVHATNNLHQQVCAISGLIINNEESRLQDHHAGRNFNSWKKLHEIHAKVMDAIRERRSGGGSVGAPGGGSSRDRGERDRRSSRGDEERERERHHRSSRDERGRRERSRSRGERPRRERSRSREREREREAPRREAARELGREAGREREREREHRGGGREERPRRERSRSPRGLEGGRGAGPAFRAGDKLEREMERRYEEERRFREARSRGPPQMSPPPQAQKQEAEPEFVVEYAAVPPAVQPPPLRPPPLAMPPPVLQPPPVLRPPM